MGHREGRKSCRRWRKNLLVVVSGEEEEGAAEEYHLAGAGGGGEGGFRRRTLGFVRSEAVSNRSNSRQSCPKQSLILVEGFLAGSRFPSSRRSLVISSVRTLPHNSPEQGFWCAPTPNSSDPPLLQPRASVRKSRANMEIGGNDSVHEKRLEDCTVAKNLYLHLLLLNQYVPQSFIHPTFHPPHLHQARVQIEGVGTSGRTKRIEEDAKLDAEAKISC
ncbi:hypothetical protein KSP40_PGU004741 [Platanthera guangdongensis]|uniref:Uncharacterized protein n=1 Tax=Platanthera guangdongensis TaxID=2320717 RepID=A0ABR2MRJ0_9ASPA